MANKKKQCAIYMGNSLVKIILISGKSVLIDEEDATAIMEHTWYCSGDGYPFTRKMIKGKYTPKILMHRFILQPTAEQVVDHINHNTLDNRKKNLRVCSKAQNSMNRRKELNQTSIYKGVSKFQRGWRAVLGHQGKQYYLGVFSCEREAAMAYNQKAKELFGEFAKLNKIYYFAGVQLVKTTAVDKYEND